MFLIVCSNIVFGPIFLFFSGVSRLIVEARHIRVVPLTVVSKFTGTQFAVIAVCHEHVWQVSWCALGTHLCVICFPLAGFCPLVLLVILE